MPRNVLVIDDSSVTVRKLTAMLEDMGHRVVGTASNGVEAVEAYRQWQPDVVTMDITMPGMDGIEATRRILAGFPDAVIIMVTSEGCQSTVMAALDAGAKGYVLKPVRPDWLARTIETGMR